MARLKTGSGPDSYFLSTSNGQRRARGKYEERFAGGDMRVLMHAISDTVKIIELPRKASSVQPWHATAGTTFSAPCFNHQPADATMP